MDGFIVSLQSDDDAHIRYWAGNAVVNSIDDAELILDVATARRTSSALQAQFLDSVVTVHPAFKGIQIKSPLNVATSL